MDAHAPLQGIAAEKCGDVAGAIAALRKAAELMPGAPQVASRLAELEEQAEAEARVAKEAAAAASEQAAAAAAAAAEEQAAAARRAAALRGKGNAAMAASDFPRAKACYTEALALGSALAPDERAKVLGNRAALHMACSEPRRALADAEAALALLPSSGKAHYRVGAAREACGDIGGAVASMQRAAALMPDAAEVTQRLRALLEAQARS